MTVKEVVAELEALGTPKVKKLWMNYGAQEPCFGVKIEDMKKILKRVKGDHELALELYETGIADAMYFAGLLVNDHKMTEADLERWLASAKPGWVADFTLPWVAGSSLHARSLATKWIDSSDEDTAAAGWSTYSAMISVTPDDMLDMAEIMRLLNRVQTTIHEQPDRVRQAMNQFMWHVGCYVQPLHELALQTANTVGVVKVDLGGSGKLPLAAEQIRKFAARGAVGRKRKSAKC